VVITNRRGSAENGVDVPIQEKISSPSDLSALIPQVFNDFPSYSSRQASYAAEACSDMYGIVGDAMKFIKEIKN
jgi:hypothetical protein